jgi:hypothetical protein
MSDSGIGPCYKSFFSLQSEFWRHRGSTDFEFRWQWLESVRVDGEPSSRPDTISSGDAAHGPRA